MEHVFWRKVGAKIYMQNQNNWLESLLISVGAYTPRKDQIQFYSEKKNPNRLLGTFTIFKESHFLLTLSHETWSHAPSFPPSPLLPYLWSLPGFSINYWAYLTKCLFIINQFVPLIAILTTESTYVEVLTVLQPYRKQGAWQGMLDYIDFFATWLLLLDLQYARFT